tara:strand:- start:12178 stop:13335 length:1158 start_codon:yes stop_codon:yes gene_type:complete
MIPLSVPNIEGNEWEYIKECLDTEWVSSAGKYVDQFEENIANYTRSKFAIACVNGTSALQIGLRLVGVGPGDEVIVPSLTFIAPVNAISYNNAKPVFMDSDEYYNIDINKTIDFLENETFFKNGFTYNKKTKNRIAAIIPVHMWGNAVNLLDLIPLCKKRNIFVVEDASESLGTIYNEDCFYKKHSGTFGDIGCISFNGNKIITSGGGGMIITDNQFFANKARYLTTQAKDDPIRYIHNEIGYNFRLTNIQAALGVAQLEKLSLFLQRKKEVFKTYKANLDKVDGLKISNVPNYADNNHWMTTLRINKESYGIDREQVMKFLQDKSIQTRPVWAPIHLQKPYSHFQRFKIEKCEKLVESSLCLPSSTGIEDDDLNYIIDSLKENL